MIITSLNGGGDYVGYTSQSKTEAEKQVARENIGSPSAYGVSAGGLNLLQPTLGTTTQNGVTCTNNGDGTYTLNGTASGGDFYQWLLPVGSTSYTYTNYKVIGCPSGGSTSSYCIGGELGVDTGSGEIYIGTKTTSYPLAIIIKSGTTVNNLLFKPMITTNLSATYNDYQPYIKSNLQLTNLTGKLSNRNLLDNGWFQVNQRGVTSGTTSSTQYLVDRWFSDNLLTYTVSNGITISTSSNSKLVQKIDSDLSTLIKGKTVTLSIMVESSVYSITFTNITTTGPSIDHTFTIGNTTLRFVAYNESDGLITLNLYPDSTGITIRAIKLELGSVSTLANDVAPNYAIELLRCSRGQQIDSSDIGTSLPLYRQEAFFTTDTTPTINGAINWTYA